ncbi:pyridoxamine 5'-phosphate oxidase family protein [Algoriphagus marinus]|uniref:pyridoxamine 5'-phosphate oxidase family protein n=1 Tax=Algoriphagus marinus TaxID=1925762 RepID=UPI00094BC239|nr:pyridoxamine 5'-phosphate oxidase family protein [Algoriphagus marinus]
MLINAKQSLPEIWTILSHELNRGALDSKHPFRYVTLATVENNSPDQRTVVLRKVDESLNFYFFTDSRTAKVKQIHANPNAEFLVYHPAKRTQIRVKGRLQIHQQNELSREMWKRVQGDAQKAYNSSLSPGTEITNPELAYDWPTELDDSFFAVLQFVPERIEALQLNGLTHVRVSFTKMGKDWEGHWLVP